MQTILMSWEDVHVIIALILCYSIARSCTVLYFGNMKGNIVSREDRYLLKILLVACKKNK